MGCLKIFTKGLIVAGFACAAWALAESVIKYMVGSYTVWENEWTFVAVWEFISLYVVLLLLVNWRVSDIPKGYVYTSQVSIDENYSEDVEMSN